MNTYTIITETRDCQFTHEVTGTHYRKSDEGNIIVLNENHDEEYVAEVDAEHFVSIIKE